MNVCACVRTLLMLSWNRVLSTAKTRNSSVSEGHCSKTKPIRGWMHKYVHIRTWSYMCLYMMYMFRREFSRFGKILVLRGSRNIGMRAPPKSTNSNDNEHDKEFHKNMLKAWVLRKLQNRYSLDLRQLKHLLVVVPEISLYLGLLLQCVLNASESVQPGVF